MAEKRMFHRALMTSDAFLDLSPEAQALYFHLGLNADDDGFLASAKTITRMVGAGAESLAALVSAGLLIRFPSGIYVIRHWRMHNALRKDRYTPTVYQRELSGLILRENGTYDPAGAADRASSEAAEPAEEPAPRVPAEPDPAGGAPLSEPECLPESAPTLQEVRDYAARRNSPVDPDRFHDYYASVAWRRGASRITDWQAVFRNWESGEWKPASEPAGRKRAVLPAARYSQRDYGGAEDSMDDVLGRLQQTNQNPVPDPA